MTMIAFACKGDHAEIITDSMAYPNMLEVFKPVTKAVVLTHLSTALMTQGDSSFGALVQGILLGATTEGAESYDELVEQMPALLRDVRDRSFGGRAIKAMIFTVGYSETLGCFRADGFSHLEDFAQHRVEGLFAFPASLLHRPHALELLEVRDDYADSPESLERIEEWAQRPRRAIPGTEVTDWLQVAAECRSRSLMDYAKVLVMGSVQYLRISRGSHIGYEIHKFDDTGDDLARMVSGSNHPVALAGPCECESGKRLVDCCAADYLDDPCECGRPNVTFRECCAAVVLDQPTA